MKPHGAPTFYYERQFYSGGYLLVAGIDEAGRAPLAGPVVAGAVILDVNQQYTWFSEVLDSKMLSRAKREYLETLIKEYSISYGIASASNQEIDDCGIARSTRKAMKSAVDQLQPGPQALLIDHFRLPEVNLPQCGITKGDNLCLSIACASILAKVARDRIMVEMDKLHPGYNFLNNKGYPTPQHLDCVKRLGPCPIHRRSFHPLKLQLGLVYET